MRIFNTLPILDPFNAYLTALSVQVKIHQNPSSRDTSFISIATCLGHGSGWANPVSLAATKEIDFSFFSSPY